MRPQIRSILIIDDDPDILMTARLVLKREFARIRTENDPSRLLDLLQRENYDVILLDMNFVAGVTSGKEGLYWLRNIRSMNSNTNVVMMTAYGDINLAVKAMKEGAVDFVVKPWDNQKLIATVTAAARLSQSEREVEKLRSGQEILKRDLDSSFTDIIGESSAMQHVYKTINKIGKTDVNVLILGENGTGKELIARALHRRSSRADKIFLNVDMGAISETLFESELFGHTKGSFTDAQEDRIGRFEIASGGTLFLDEIGNLSLPLQSKLLSAIQNREITRIGSNKSIAVDIRLICATNMPVHEMVSKNTFRQDLLYRINTVEVKLPPLRERKKDVPLLTDHFLRMYSRKYNKNGISISKDAIKKLEDYHWPGNIREMQHVIERVLIMSDARTLKPSDFVLDKDEDDVMLNSMNLDELEKNAIRNALKLFEGNLSKAARELGLGRTTLYRKMSKYGL